ncbi:MAG: DUF6476 family protein [Pseudomonadota bacterium]
MADAPEGENRSLPAELRWLKALVMGLTAAMILGVITIVALLVIRLGTEPQTILVAPEVYPVPPGLQITGYALSGSSVIIVTDDGVIRVFDVGSRALIQEVPVTPPEG